LEVPWNGCAVGGVRQLTGLVGARDAALLEVTCHAASHKSMQLCKSTGTGCAAGRHAACGVAVQDVDAASWTGSPRSTLPRVM
jgi:hypothetical protein